MALTLSALESVETVKVLIAGATGFIGSNLVHHFLKRGHEVHVIMRKDSPTWRIEEVLAEVSIHRGDLSQYEKTEAIIRVVRPQAVLDAAGLVSGFSQGDQVGVVQSNLQNVVNVVNACLPLTDCMLVCTGSAYEYGFSPSPLGEDDRGRPIGLYGIAKAAATEYLTQVAKRHDRKLATLRLFLPYGYFDSPRRLVPQVIVSLLRDIRPTINSPQSGRDFLFIEDMCKAYELLILNQDKVGFGDVFNIGTGRLTTVAEAAGILATLFDTSWKPDTSAYSASNESIAPYLYADVSKALLVFGWRPETSLRDGLVKTKAWFELNLNRY